MTTQCAGCIIIIILGEYLLNVIKFTVKGDFMNISDEMLFIIGAVGAGAGVLCLIVTIVAYKFGKVTLDTKLEKEYGSDV